MGRYNDESINIVGYAIKDAGSHFFSDIGMKPEGFDPSASLESFFAYRARNSVGYAKKVGAEGKSLLANIGSRRTKGNVIEL